MLRNDRIICFEPFDLTDPLMRAAERLYEATQKPDERIPWGWIARSVKASANWRPGQPGRHLLLAMPEQRRDDPDALAGFAYGTQIPGYGGYISYIGVAAEFRQRGVGSRLFRQMFRLLEADAGAADEALPFIVWESHKPEPGAADADWKLWEARTRLFDRVGGLWVDGLELHTPNYSVEDGPPVLLQLFVKPMAEARPDPHELARGLLERVYRMTPDDPLYQATMAKSRAKLRPALEANSRSTSKLKLATV